MEQINSISTRRASLNFNFNYKELGVFSLLLFLNLKFIAITVTQSRSTLIDLIVYFLLVATFNYANWTYKSLTQAAIIIGVFTLINFSPYKLNVLMPLLIIQSVSGISFKKYLSINFLITGITLLIMFIINGEGHNIAGFSFLFDRKIRMTFGFGHPNSAALYYYCFMVNGLLLLYFSRFKKRCTIYMFLIVPLWIYIYEKTASRSFLLSIIVLYLSYFYYIFGLYFNKNNIFRISNYFYIALLFIFSLTTLFFSLQSENYPTLDRILSKRLTYYNIFLDQIDFTDFFFGSNAYKHLVIDSSYIHLLFEGGILFFIGFSLFYIFSTIKMVNKKEWIPICVIISFMAYGLMETVFLFNMLIGTNIFWLTLYFYYKNGKMKI